MTRQARLFEPAALALDSASLILGEANRAAAALLGDPAGWPGGALALVGPAGSGKSHLAAVWREASGAAVLGPAPAPAEITALVRGGARALLLDPADSADADALMPLLDLARDGAVRALLVSRERPGLWPAADRDVRSRLAALAVAEVREPDLELLAGVLRRLCRARYLELSPSAALYCAKRMPRSFAAARTLADAFDREVEKGAEPLTQDMARRVLARAGFEERMTEEA